MIFCTRVGSRAVAGELEYNFHSALYVAAQEVGNAELQCIALNPHTPSDLVFCCRCSVAPICAR
jgi:hypothetical protein